PDPSSPYLYPLSLHDALPIFHVRVRQNDNVVLCPSLALHAFAAGGGARVNVLGNGRGTHKADGAHLRMIAKRVDDLAAAVDEIQDRKSTRLNSSHLVISYAVF